MFNLFHEIVLGQYRPHLIDGDRISIIKGLLEGEFYVDKETKNLKSDNEYMNLWLELGHALEIGTDEQNPDNNYVKIITNENLQELINIDIPPPPDEKSYLYLLIIEQEIEIIKYKINSFLKNTNDYKSIELFALKNIQILKGLSEPLRLYIKRLGGEHGNLFVTDSNHFILYVLKYYIIDVIQFLQKTFSPFINTDVESEDKLGYELFHDYFPGIPMLSIFPLLPKTEEYEHFKKEFIVSNKDELKKNKLNKKGLSVGTYLFNHYRSKYKSLCIKDQISSYNKEIHFWNELLITNRLKTFIFDAYVNEPEIEEILLPLIKNEISSLLITSDVKKQTSGDAPSCNPKEYKSLTRVRAFYIGLLQESKKHNFLNEKVLKKGEIIKYVEETWEGQSGKTVYEHVMQIVSEKNPININYRDRYLKDYEFSLKLFKMEYPDS